MRKWVCVCVCVFVSVSGLNCMGPCPCRVSHTDQALSPSGSAGWSGHDRKTAH